MSRKYLAWKRYAPKPAIELVPYHKRLLNLWDANVIFGGASSAWLKTQFDDPDPRRWFPLKTLSNDYATASKRRRYRLRGKGCKWMNAYDDVIDFEALPATKRNLAPFIQPLKAD